MTAETSSLLYAGLTALPFVMQVSLAAGAPLGRFTVGGRFDGRLPPIWRGLAVVQAVLLAGMAWVVLTRGGILTFGLSPVLFWATVVVTGATFMANAASPSRAERLLWTPVTALMLAAVVVVALH